jgi:hypothetical protein
VSILFANGKVYVFFRCMCSEVGRVRSRDKREEATHLCLCFLFSAGTIDFISPLNSDSICSETSYMNPGSYSI